MTLSSILIDKNVIFFIVENKHSSECDLICLSEDKVDNNYKKWNP